MSAIPKSFDGRRPAQPVQGVSYTTRSIAVNSSEFISGNTALFKLPGHLESSYLDPSSSFLRVKFVNNSGSKNFTMGVGGLNSLISKVNVSQAGNTLVDISDYGKYVALETAITADNSWYSGQGNALCGAHSIVRGAQVDHTTDNELVMCSPLQFHGGLFGQSKAVPLAGMEIDYRITFGDASYGGAWEADASPSANWKKFIEVELVLQIIQLSDQSNAMIRKMNPNWSILTKGVGTYNASLAQHVSQSSVNLGASYSQLLGYNFVMTDSSPSGGEAVTNNGEHFKQNNLKRHNLSVDGVLVENGKSITADVPAEIVAFNAIEKGTLAKMTGLPLLTHGNVTNISNSGCVFSQSLEIFKASCSGFANYAKENFCTGRSTISSTTVLGLEFGSNGAQFATNLTLFAKYAQLITYDDEHKIFRISQ
tara:strand:+ start:3262 stop:4533 length:1272 start_codon:yes stop_codon:yes gene_type:complete